MSIHLRDVFVPASHPNAAGPLFEGIEMGIPDGARIGVFGPSKSGKSTLLRLMCGTALVERGRVERSSRVSWPIPLDGFFSPAGTVAQNIRFVARLYGVAEADFCRRVSDPMGLDEYLGVPLKSCPNFVKPRLALAVGVAIDFDIYLFDGSLAGTDKTFKTEAAQFVAERTVGRGYVLATANPNEAEKRCDSAYVLDAGRARYFADAEEAVNCLKEMIAAQKAKAAARQEKRPSEDDGEAELLGDVDMVAAAVADAVD